MKAQSKQNAKPKLKTLTSAKVSAKGSFTGFSDEMYSGSIHESIHGHRFNIDSYSNTIMAY
jgi:hypothetical protein